MKSVRAANAPKNMGFREAFDRLDSKNPISFIYYFLPRKFFIFQIYFSENDKSGVKCVKCTEK